MPWDSITKQWLILFGRVNRGVAMVKACKNHWNNGSWNPRHSLTVVLTTCVFRSQCWGSVVQLLGSTECYADIHSATLVGKRYQTIGVRWSSYKLGVHKWWFSPSCPDGGVWWLEQPGRCKKPVQRLNWLVLSLSSNGISAWCDSCLPC